jgi:hypothetical protein
MCIEHPAVTEYNRKGYLNVLAQNECCGIDWFGFEILSGDEIVEFDGEIVLKEYLEDFLKAIGFKFYMLIDEDIVEYDGDVSFKNDLDEFLESLGFEFKNAY